MFSFDFAIKYHEMDQTISKLNIDNNPIDYIVATRNIAICYRGIEEYKKSIDSLKEVYFLIILSNREII